MERRTMGGLIAALRKAGGMTQKELAERLNVSDKSVSRWERDEGAPDLSLIPVIAEIFGVTCDELLRGERRPVPQQETQPAGDGKAKGEKQRQRLLAVSLSRYKTRTFISMGISVAGLIAAMAGNFGFLRAYLGFLGGAVFYLAGVICQAVSLNSAFLAVDDDSLDPLGVKQFRWSAVRLAQWSFGLTAVLLSASLPLVVFPNDAYVGLSGESWLLYGLLFAAVGLALTAAVCWYLNGRLLKSGVCVLKGRQEECYFHNHRLKKRCAVGGSAVLAVTLLVHAFGSEMLWDSYHLAKGITFHDYDSFVAFMEQDVPYDGYGLGTAAPENAVAPVPETAIPGSTTYYDEYGNEISEEEALKSVLNDRDGSVVCEYIRRNETVSSIRYTPGEGTALPVTVITHSDYRAARNLSGIINGAYCLLYPLELGAALLVYFRKRMK